MRAARACRTVFATMLTASAITLSGDRVAAQEVQDFARPEITDSWNLNTQWLTDDFTISKLYSVTQIRVWTWENVLESPYKGQFYWSMMLDQGGYPSAKEPLASGLAEAKWTLDTSRIRKGFNLMVYEFAIDPVKLAEGTYWLSLHNGPLDDTSEKAGTMFWATQEADKSATARYIDLAGSQLELPGAELVDVRGDWSDTNAQLAFEVIGEPMDPSVTPEPVTFVLLGSGLAALAGAARRRRKRDME